MKKLFHIVTLLYISVLFFVFPVTYIHAQTNNTSGNAQGTITIGDKTYTQLAPISVSNRTYDSFGEYLDNLYYAGLAIASGLAVLMIIYGGVRYMSTEAISGKSEGREIITAAIGGLLLAFFSWLILYTINPKLLKKDLPNTTFTELDQVNLESVSNFFDTLNGLFTSIPQSEQDKLNQEVLAKMQDLIDREETSDFGGYKQVAADLQNEADRLAEEGNTTGSKYIRDRAEAVNTFIEGRESFDAFRQQILLTATDDSLKNREKILGVLAAQEEYITKSAGQVQKLVNVGLYSEAEQIRVMANNAITETRDQLSTLRGGMYQIEAKLPSILSEPI